MFGDPALVLHGIEERLQTSSEAGCKAGSLRVTATAFGLSDCGQARLSRLQATNIAKAHKWSEKIGIRARPAFAAAHTSPAVVVCREAQFRSHAVQTPCGSGRLRLRTICASDRTPVKSHFGSDALRFRSHCGWDPCASDRTAVQSDTNRHTARRAGRTRFWTGFDPSRRSSGRRFHRRFGNAR